MNGRKESGAGSGNMEGVVDMAMKAINGVRYLTPDVREEISIDRPRGYVYHRVKCTLPDYSGTKWHRYVIHTANKREYFNRGKARQYFSAFKTGITTWEDWKAVIEREARYGHS